MVKKIAGEVLSQKDMKLLEGQSNSACAKFGHATSEV